MRWSIEDINLTVEVMDITGKEGSFLEEMEKSNFLVTKNIGEASYYIIQGNPVKQIGVSKIGTAYFVFLDKSIPQTVYPKYLTPGTPDDSGITLMVDLPKFLSAAEWLVYKIKNIFPDYEFIRNI